MFRESFKYMLLSLFVACLLIAGAWYLLFGRALFAARRAAAPSPSPTATTQALSSTASVPSPTAPAPTVSPTPAPTPTPDPDAALLSYVASLPLDEKLGQLALFGFSGTDAPGDAFMSVFSDYRVGNAMLYGANIASGDSDGGFGRAAALTETVRAGMDTSIPPLVGIDVEGGKVVRFRWDSWPASARTLGRHGSTELAFTQFAEIGRALNACGINLDLAPVLDVSEDPMSTFLETRIISGSAATAAEIGAAMIGGLHDAGVLSGAKHFPGHGGTREDSHETTPVVDKSADELRGYDLIPFAAAVDAGADVILVAHILYPALDGNDIASMSRPIMTDLLRDTLGFDGVIMSDDFRMGGLTSRYDPGDAAVQFILAGGDLILCGAQSDRQRAIMEGLTAAAADGTLPIYRIDESVARILKAKQRVSPFLP